MRELLIFVCLISCIVAPSAQSMGADNLQNTQWKPLSGIQIDNTNETGLYRVRGRESGSWTYARLLLQDFVAKKGERYRLEALIKVNNVSSKAMPPFLKIATSKNNRFIKNYNSPKYNLLAKGQWQKLWREFEVEDNDSTYHLAIEKGTTKAVDIDMEIKDIKFSKIPSFTKSSSDHIYGLRKSAVISQPVSCQHPCLHLNDAKLVALKQQIKQQNYAKYWRDVERRANEFSLQQPPSSIYTHSEAGIRSIGDRLPFLALAFRITGDQRYLEANRRWLKAILSYDNWASNKDLGAAHLLYGLAITYDWLYYELNEAEKKAITRKVERQANILARSLTSGNIGWARNYLNSHNYVNAMALGVTGKAFQEAIPAAKTWAQAVDKNFTQVLDALSPDGASHEGVGYWSYGLDALLKYYDAVATEQMRKKFRDSTHLQNASTYRLYMSLPGYTQNVDYADSPREDYFGPGYLLRQLSTMFNDGRARWLADAIELARPDKQFSWLDLLWYDTSVKQKDPSDLPRTHHFNNLGIVVSRSNWEANASWVFYKAGDPQGEHAKSLGLYEGGHIHPDAGNILWWANGNWVLQDDGYTAVKLTKNHNAMTFNGYGQLGEGSKWFDRGGFVDNSRTALISRANFSDEFNAVESYIGKIYPQSAGVRQWKRTLFWFNSYLIVHDNLELNSTIEVQKYFHLSDGKLLQSGLGRRFLSTENGKVCIYNSGSDRAQTSYSYEKEKGYSVPKTHKHRNSYRLVFTSSIRGKNISHTTVFDSAPNKTCGKLIDVDGGTIKISDKTKIVSCGVDSLECNLGNRPRATPSLQVE